VIQRRGRDQGSAAVEFILVLPVLLVVLFAIVDIGRMLHAKLVLAEAAGEGVRVAALLDDNDARITINDIVGDMRSDIDRYHIDDCDGAGPGASAEVTLTYHFEFVTPLIGGDDGVEITQTTVMPCL
jgi:hypothetical protein